MSSLYLLHQLTAFLIGLCMGSLLNVAIWRIPLDLSMWWPPSHCPVCETPIAWYDNVPLVSWIVLGGRCRHCGAPISPLYPVLELLGGLLGWLAWRRFVPDAAHLDAVHIVAAVWGYAFIWLMLLAAYADLRARIIPEVASLYAIPLGIGGAWLLETMGYWGWMDIGWRMSILGALTGGGLLGGLSLLWRLLVGREGLGWGDVRLIAMIGAFVGPLPGLWTVLLLGSVLGAVVGASTLLIAQRSVYLPFGPSLAAAAIAWTLYGDWLLATFFPGMAGLL